MCKIFKYFSIGLKNVSSVGISGFLSLKFTFLFSKAQYFSRYYVLANVTSCFFLFFKSMSTTLHDLFFCALRQIH